MMERALKERIIGAAVLVVFVVLVVPIFLDGPPEDGATVTERVLLPGQDSQKTQTVVLDRDRTEPVPVTPAPTQQETDESADEPVAEQQPVAPVKREEPRPASQEPAPEPVMEKPAANSSTGMWAVQLGSFSNKDNADKLAAELRKQGYAAFLSQLRTTNGLMHRVRVGPQKDRESAEAMAARLARAGQEGKVVPHP